MFGSGRVARLATFASIVAMVVGACGGAAPPGSTTASLEPSGGAPDGLALVDYAETGDPGAAAQRELELVREMRDDAGMPALIGASGPAAFDTLDAIEAEFGRGVVKAVAAAVESGQLPQGATIDPLAGRLASTDGAPSPSQPAPDAIDISLFADTGFTASAIMGLYIGLVERAAESQSGTIPRQEHFEQTADGLRQSVDLNTTMTVQTGGGRVSADITMSATDNIFDAASGSFVALYTSTATGHFDVNACPDTDGVGAGTYTFETKHELNDVSSTGGASRSGAGRTVDAPFKLINGDDAKLQRIEANLDLGADARGPGSASGSGPTAPFDWTASQQIPIVMLPTGGTTAAGATGLTVTGTGGERAVGTMFLSSAMAQLFMGQVGKEAETFWRSGKCIELKTSEETRDVDPDEEITLAVDAIHKFDAQQVRAPIVAEFGGTKALEPTGSPVEPPASFDFVAGHERGEKGTIKLTQTSKRGIGRKSVVFTVAGTDLIVTIRGEGTTTLSSLTQSGTVSAEIRATSGPDGLYRGTGTIDVAGRTQARIALVGSCVGSYRGTREGEAYVTRDEADPTRLTLSFFATAGGSIPYQAPCDNGEPLPGDGVIESDVWLLPLVNEVTVELGVSKAFRYSDPVTSSTVTVTITEPPSPS